MHRLDRHLHILLLRKREDKFASLALLGCEGDLLAVSLDDLFGYGQSQSGSGLVLATARIRLVESLKYLLLGILWNSHAFILDACIYLVVLLSHLNPDLASLRCELYGVVNQIVYNLLYLGSVGVYHCVVGEEYAVQENSPVLAPFLKCVDGRCDDIPDIEVGLVKLQVK